MAAMFNVTNNVIRTIKGTKSNLPSNELRVKQCTAQRKTKLE